MAPFDPHARLVDQETGLEYAGVAEKLLGEPAQSVRNDNVTWYRRRRYPEHAIKAYWQAFDGPSKTDFALTKIILGPCRELGRRQDTAIAAAKATGCWGSASSREEAKDSLGKCLNDRIDRITYDILAGNVRFDPVNFGVVAIDTL